MLNDPIEAKNRKKTKQHYDWELSYPEDPPTYYLYVSVKGDFRAQFVIVSCLRSKPLEAFYTDKNIVVNWDLMGI